jgi:tRNA A37 methylthiotransferase MiaB
VYFDLTDYCEEAKLDTQQLVNLIKLSNEQSNFRYTNSVQDADLIIYRACGHLESQQNESIRDIKKLLSIKKSGAKLLVWGCLAKINPDSLKEVYDGPLIGPEESWDFFCDYFSVPKTSDDVFANLLKIPNIFNQAEQEQRSQTKKKKAHNPFEPQLQKLFYLKKKLIMQNMWYIKIVSGCKNNCTYCSDRLAYKSVKSVPIEEIVEQFELGLNKGYRYFYLVGRDSGSYGYDKGITLVDLLNKVVEKNRQIDYKIFVNNFSPSSLVELYPKLQPVLESQKIGSIGSHIQSGSNRVLKLMGKKISVEKWGSVIKDIRKKYPKIKLETSIMVGFPSETDKDFEQTLTLLDNVEFDRIDVYKYNERPNLPSLRIPNPVPETTKNKRYNQIKYQFTICKMKKRLKHIQLLTIADLNLFINTTRLLLGAHNRDYLRELSKNAVRD